MRVVPSKAERIRSVMMDRIRVGYYPVGSRLPSLREASKEFDVHSTTVEKVYAELANLELVRSMHGKGTFVIGVPSEAHSRQAMETLLHSLQALVVQARRLGVSHRDWTNLVSEAEAAGFSSDGPRLWFVECSPNDADELAASLRALLDLSVRPLLVDDLPHHLVAGSLADDLFITTPFHVQEVELAVADRNRVVTVNVVPTSATLVRFAQLAASEKVAIITSNRETMDRFVHMLRTYTRLDPVATAVADDPAASEAVKQATVVVDSQSIHHRVMEWNPPGEVLTVRYQIEPTSVAFLREVLRRHGEARIPTLT